MNGVSFFEIAYEIIGIRFWYCIQRRERNVTNIYTNRSVWCPCDLLYLIFVALVGSLARSLSFSSLSFNLIIFNRRTGKMLKIRSCDFWGYLSPYYCPSNFIRLISCILYRESFNHFLFYTWIFKLLHTENWKRSKAFCFLYKLLCRLKRKLFTKTSMCWRKNIHFSKQLNCCQRLKANGWQFD